MKDYLRKLTFNHDKAEKFFERALAYEICPYSLKQTFENNIEEINIVDVRAYEDYVEGHIPFAIHVPPQKLMDNLNKFEKEKINVLYCYKHDCQLAKMCCLELAQKGYPVKELIGGFKGWKDSEYDVVITSAEGF